MSIPKIIHQIWWQGHENIPKKMLENKITWKLNHKKYTFILWDKYLFEKLLAKLNISILNEIYNDLPKMIQKIDFCKYVILYNYGGIYVDIDTISEKPIDKFLSMGDLVISKIKIFKYFDFYLINNGIIFSKKKTFIF